MAGAERGDGVPHSAPSWRGHAQADVAPHQDLSSGSGGGVGGCDGGSVVTLCGRCWGGAVAVVAVAGGMEEGGAPSGGSGRRLARGGEGSGRGAREV